MALKMKCKNIASKKISDTYIFLEKILYEVLYCPWAKISSKTYTKNNI